MAVSFTMGGASGGGDGGEAVLRASDAVNEVIGGSGGNVRDDGAVCDDVDEVAEAAVNNGGLSEAVLLASVTGGVVAGRALALAAGGVVAYAGDLKYLVMRFWLHPDVKACEEGFDGERGGVAWTSPVSMVVTKVEVREAKRC